MTDLMLYDGPENVQVSIETLVTLVSALEKFEAIEEVNTLLKANRMGFEASSGLISFTKTFLYKHDQLEDSGAEKAIVASAHCPKRPDSEPRPPRDPRPSPSPTPKPPPK